MEEIEVPTEQAQEEIAHHAKHSGESWIMMVALTSAIFAVLAAIAALLAGHHSNEAVISQIKASDKWGYFQGKSIKADVLDSRIALLAALGKEAPATDLEHRSRLAKEKDEIQEQAKAIEEEGESHLRIHHLLSEAVTMFQVTIAIGAIAVLTRRRPFWFVSLVTGAIGVVFFVQGLFAH